MLDGNELRAIGLEDVQALAEAYREAAGVSQFYVFRTSGEGAGSGGERRPRTLLAFTEADTALSFAQRNGATSEEPIRLRQLSLAQLLLAVCRDPSISILLLVQSDDNAAPGRYPAGLRIPRTALLEQLGNK